MAAVDYEVAAQVFKEEGGSRKKAAEKLGVSPDALRHILDRGKRQIAPELSVQDERRFRDQIAALKRQNDMLARQINADEDLRSSVFGLSREPLSIPFWVSSRKKQDTSSCVPVLFVSDLQYGEKVDIRLNRRHYAYDLKIAKRRYHTCIEKAVQLCFVERTNTRYPGVVYVRGGDSISGDIHQELRETNEITSIQSVREVAALEIAGINRLLEVFDKIAVLSVAGNHGRTTIKPVSKTYASTNFDTLISWMIESHFTAKNEKRVTFHTSTSGDIYCEIAGHNTLITHGDRMGVKGGDGFIGIVGPVARGFKKLRLQYQSMGMPVSYILAGHFHTNFEVDNGFINGTLVGYSEYAQGLRLQPEPPSQTLLFFHPDWGVTDRQKLYLDPPESHTRKSLLPNFE